LSTVSQTAWVNQKFPDYPDFSSFLADDFSNTDSWLVNTIFIPGDGWSGFTSLMNASALTWQIHADDGSGVPDGDPSGGGNPPVWTLTLPPLNPHVVLATGSGGKLSDVILNPPTPVVLPPGDWWLVFYPTMEFDASGQYGRQPADTTNGYVGQFINPGDGFGHGTDWQDWTVLGPTQQDIAFRLEGIVLPEMGAISWLSADLTSDSLPGGACQDVAVTFDATGLAPGDYESDLVILSNDLSTPTMTVTALLNVPEPVFGATFSWTPASPVAGTPVDFTASVGGGTPPFTYSWSFDDGSSGSGDAVSHVYTTAGTYSPELVVENVCGVSTSTDTLTVEPSTIYNYLPIVIKNH
jgi:hypothetical protein